MTKLGKKNQKRLAKLVVAALMCGGGLCSLPSVASASEVTVTNVTVQGNGYAVTSDPADGMTWPPGSSAVHGAFYPATANVLNIMGTFNATTATIGGIQFSGGYSTDGAVSGKTVNIDGTDIAVGNITGGRAKGNYSVTGNHVNFLGGTTTVQQTITGGIGVNGADVSDNHVKIAAGSTVKYDFYGGYGTNIMGGSGNEDVDANTVTISGKLTPASENATLNVVGGATDGDGKAATGNSVTITDATFTTGEGNLVTISGGESSGTDGNATGNTVTISGNSTFGNGKAYIYGGYSQSGAANDNTVEISGGTLKGTIYGGMGQTTANGNTVTISGGTLSEKTYIYGGLGGTEAKNNIININGGRSGFPMRNTPYPNAPTMIATVSA